MVDAPLPTYTEICARLRIDRCSRCSDVVHDTSRGGGPQGRINGTVLHWSDRAPTRAGIRRFLHLAALLRQPRGYDWPHWRRFYMAELQVADWAAQLHVRFVRELNDQYRRELRAMLATVPGPDKTPLYRRALRYAERRQ